ncbi:hypothetical protein GQ44DRAFT_14605 [Phaeosphaeriaceae sp. PMI808]|nr:hypothetical protein GQ44DRAFT_14605 [Phaeosphaeriaceae sp. PMI808]
MKKPAFNLLPTASTFSTICLLNFLSCLLLYIFDYFIPAFTAPLIQKKLGHKSCCIERRYKMLNFENLYHSNHEENGEEVLTSGDYESIIEGSASLNIHECQQPSEYTTGNSITGNGYKETESISSTFATQDKTDIRQGTTLRELVTQVTDATRYDDDIKDAADMQDATVPSYPKCPIMNSEAPAHSYFICYRCDKPRAHGDRFQLHHLCIFCYHNIDANDPSWRLRCKGGQHLTAEVDFLTPDGIEMETCSHCFSQSGELWE